ncbi:MAG: hypothetical protein ACM3ST_12935, partial [Bdellovibrio bacteriovorus]
KTNPLRRADLDEFVACYFGANPVGAASAAQEGSGVGFKVDPGPDGVGVGLKPDLRVRSRHARIATWSEATPEGRWRAYAYEELVARDKASLDIFWLKDDSLADSDNLPPPEVIAQEIVEDLEAALEQFRLIAADLNGGTADVVIEP